YGDVRHRHFKEPADTRKLVDVANVLAGSLGRPLNWIHLPVPRNRVDEAYYSPLGELRLRAETQLHLRPRHPTHRAQGATPPAQSGRPAASLPASLRHRGAAGPAGRPPRFRSSCVFIDSSARPSSNRGDRVIASRGRPASSVSPTKTGRGSRSTPSGSVTTPSRTTAGTRTSTRRWRTWRGI